MLALIPRTTATATATSRARPAPCTGPCGLKRPAAGISRSRARPPKQAQRIRYGTNLGVERLDAAVEDLGRARVLRDILDGEARVADGLGRPAGGEQLDALPRQEGGQLHQARLVGDGEQRALHRPEVRLGALHGRDLWGRGGAGVGGETRGGGFGGRTARASIRRALEHLTIFWGCRPLPRSTNHGHQIIHRTYHMCHGAGAAAEETTE